MISMISEGEIWMIIRSQKARNIIEVIHGKSMPHLRLHTTFIADRGRPFTDESVTPRGHQKYVFFLVFFGICYVSFLHLWSWSFFGPPSSDSYILHLVLFCLASSFPFLRDPCGSLGISGHPWESLAMFGDRQSLGFSRDLWGFCWGSLQIYEKHLKNKKEKGKEHKRTEVLHVNPFMILRNIIQNYPIKAIWA